MSIPDYVKFNQFPVEIQIHLPDDICTIEVSDEPNDCYNQLILFIIIQSYWYYVLGESRVTDEEFDYIKNVIKKMEQEDTFDELSCMYKNSANPNGYSPSANRGNRCNHHSSRYPLFVQRIFENIKNGYDTWRIRPWWLDLTINGKEVVVEKQKKYKRPVTSMEFADADD